MKKTVLKYSYGRQTITKRDIQAVIRALKSPNLTQGPMIAEFEQTICKLVGAKYAVAVTNGTAALHLACLSAGVGSGDEGITSAMTFVASANCIAYCGGTVRLADIDETTGLIDPQEIKKKITKKTKVIIPVHYAGQSCDMERIRALTKGRKITIIEDAAHAIGSEYKGTKVGSCTYSDMTVFSFHPVKTITTGEGGVITTNRKNLYDKLITLRTHGITKDPSKFAYSSHASEPWYYEMQELGFNYRITDIQAALGTSQLSQIAQFIKRRNQLVSLYDQLFSNHPFITPLRHVPYGKSCRHLYVIRIDFRALGKKRRDIMNSLATKGIGTQVHYIPVYAQPYYVKKYAFDEKNYPQTNRFYGQCLSIPLYSALTQREARQIGRVIIHECHNPH